MRARIAIFVALLALGCGDDDGTAPPSPGEGRGPQLARDTVPDLPPPAIAGESADRRSARWAPRTAPAGGSAVASAPPSAPASAPSEPPSPRDPSADLAGRVQRAFGAPLECLSEPTRARVRDTLTVQLEVQLMPSGRVTRASVAGSELSAEDRECMQRRAEGLSIGPVPDAPRSVQTTVTYAIQSTRTERTTREYEPIDRPRTEVAADRALPAAGTETERPPGFVPPSSTLPAITP